MTAMDEEFRLIAERFDTAKAEAVGPRTFLSTSHKGLELVLVSSRIGKVAAAVTTSILIHQYNVDAILFTGVAGAADSSVRIGDIVVADSLIQHDIDLKGVMGFERFDVPLLGVRQMRCAEELVLVAQEAASKLVLNPEYVRGVGGFTKNLPKVHRGVIASGDTFVCDTKERDDLTSAIPNLKCVEMEGAAVAQVCVEHNVPWVVARIISDEASHEAAIDFGAFVQSAAAVGSELFVRGIISHLVAP
jgi:adenosylhomocysteine nucleosidase